MFTNKRLLWSDWLRISGTVAYSRHKSVTALRTAVARRLEPIYTRYVHWGCANLMWGASVDKRQWRFRRQTHAWIWHNYVTPMINFIPGTVMFLNLNIALIILVKLHCWKEHYFANIEAILAYRPRSLKGVASHFVGAAYCRHIFHLCIRLAAVPVP